MKIFVSMQLEVETELPAQEVVASVEANLAQFKHKGLAFATTSRDEEITVLDFFVQEAS